MNSIAQTTVLLPKSAQFRLIFQVTQPWFRVWLPNAGLKSHWRSARVWLGVGAVGGFAVLLMMMAACAAVLAVALTSVVTIMRDMGCLMCWDVIDLTWLRRHTLKGFRAAHAGCSRNNCTCCCWPCQCISHERWSKPRNSNLWVPHHVEWSLVWRIIAWAYCLGLQMCQDKFALQSTPKDESSYGATWSEESFKQSVSTHRQVRSDQFRAHIAETQQDRHRSVCGRAFYWSTRCESATAELHATPWRNLPRRVQICQAIMSGPCNIT